MPSFLVIGAMKAGTTSLYYYLKQHPQIHMSPVKEPWFFCYEGERLNFRGPGDEYLNRNAITNLEAYRAHFGRVSTALAIGEASVLYLYVSKTASRIRHHIPQAKLIAILRNPVDRAYSNFLHQQRAGVEPYTAFPDALQDEPRRIRENWAPQWHYLRAGFYHGQLKRYFDRFERKQIRVYLSDDLHADPLAMIKGIFRFLQVDDSFTPDVSLRYNVTRIPRSKTFQQLLQRQHALKFLTRPLLPKQVRQHIFTNLYERNLTEPPPLSPALRHQLLELYRPDILKLQELIQRDLSKWLEHSSAVSTHCGGE
jgi:hypothetical protein